MGHQGTQHQGNILADRLARVALEPRISGHDAGTLIQRPRTARTEPGRVIRIDDRHRGDLDGVVGQRIVDRHGVGDFGAPRPQQQVLAEHPGAVRPERRAAFGAQLVLRSPALRWGLAAARIVDQLHATQR